VQATGVVDPDADPLTTMPQALTPTAANTTAEVALANVLAKIIGASKP
jgi:hypothetical protein